MTKNVTLLLFAALLILAGCSSADQKVPEMAADYCNCFSSMEKEMSSKTKEIMMTAGNSADPVKTIQAEMEKLSEEDKQSVGNEFAEFATIDDKNSKIGKCMTDVEKKYGSAKTMNEKKFLQKLISELDAKQGCSFGAALMKIGQKAKEKGTIE